VKNSKAVITDSGGITEETTVMGIPCITLRNYTKLPETIEIGTYKLINTDLASLNPDLDKLIDGDWKRKVPSPNNGMKKQRKGL
jgi:UDP-N-acetylglucosamine 2-epimerase (non-hydrolysing)